MPAYLHWIDIAADVFCAIGILCVLLRKWQVIDPTPRTRLANFLSWGLGLCCLAASLAIPPTLSPRKTVTGNVRSFHQVRKYRSSYFSFSVNAGQSSSGELHANYFDRGFYHDDPAVSDGDVVTTTYLEWTSEVVSMKELAGRHPGWSFEHVPNYAGPVVFGFGGLALIVGGVLSVLSDILAKPEDAPSEQSSSNSILRK
jgi:hypothetical protein